MLNHYHQGHLRLTDIARLMATSPSYVYGINGKGQLAVDNDADIVLVDLDKEWQVGTSGAVLGRSGWSPYEGMHLKGLPVRTYLRGLCVMADGELIGKAQGQKVLFNEASVK